MTLERSSRWALLAWHAALLWGGVLRGQEHSHAAHGGTPHLGAMAVLVASQVQPAAHDATRREAYLSQPVVSLSYDAWHGALSVEGLADGEGAVMRRGELTPGIYGEGYVDRRHPHTMLHELMLTGAHRVRSTSLSLSVGKGFAPFGSDDPMMRPFQKFPINHHLSQILERALVIGAAHSGPLLIEGAVFNGDEPTGPADWPNLDRIGDSWSARATLTPRRGFELTASAASVHSPEDVDGQGLNQRKVHAGLRVEPSGRTPYLLAEWARTEEYRQSRRVWRFASVLVEAGTTVLGTDVAVRAERTTRPDEERISDFRTIRPLLDFGILGRSRWDVATLHLGTSRSTARWLHWSPFVEASVSGVRPTILPTTFVPRDFYGRSTLWMLSTGVRVHAGRMPARMGRYGAARTSAELP
ncbi:MAG: hypothetical protein U0163_09595 [Gemmatimonadaceae bacterium]